MNIALQVRNVLLEFPYIQLAILFGSRVNDRANSSSDIDVAVSAAARALLPAEKMAIIESIALKTGCPVDLVDLATVSEPLLGQIIQNGQRLLGGDAPYAKLMSRHWIEKADFVPYQARIFTERQSAWIAK